MTRIESFEEWERETLDSFPDEKIREAFNKARTKIEFELMVKEFLRERHQEYIKNRKLTILFNSFLTIVCFTAL
mgnify:FL=1